MKLKHLLMKTLFVAAGLCVGQSVWADATTAFSADFTDKGSTDPSEYGFNVTYGSGSGSSLVNFSVTGGVLQCVAGPYANPSDGARTGTATAAFSSVGAGNEVTVSFVWALGSATGNASGSYTKTRIGNASGNALELSFYGSESNGSLKVNGTTVAGGNAAIRNTTYTVNATLNMNTQKITALTLTCSNATYSYTASDAIDFASAITSVDRFAFENSERQNWGNTSSIDNVNITYEEAKESVESFVVNYKYGETIIVSENIGTAGLYCGDTYESLPYRKYIVKDGVLYETTANTGADDYYHQKNISLVKNTVVNKSLSLVNLNGGTIVFFKDFDGATGNNASIRASYGSAYDNTQFTSEEDLPAGRYTFMTRAYSRNRGSSVKVGNQQVFTIAAVGGSWQDKTFTDVDVPAAGKLALVKGAGGTTDPVDIIIAILHSVPATIGSTGWTTFASAYPLDLSSMTASTGTVAAYYASSSNASSVTMTSTDATVAANTGLMLKGTAGATITIPVAATGSELSGNLLKGCTAETVVASNANKYVLVNKGGTAEFQNLSEQGATIPAGKAYLDATGAGARSLTIVFDDEDVTGVNEVRSQKEDVRSEWFDLQGRKVAQPAKGLYIVNGKKVVIK